MREIIKNKIDGLPDEEVEKSFSLIIDAIGSSNTEKIDLHKNVPGMFEKYEELMKKLA